MALIKLEKMEFYAYIGCFDDEKIVGNPFIVEFEFFSDTFEAQEDDNLEKTVDYSVIYHLIEKEMSVKCNLVENVCYRILKTVQAAFPQIQFAMVEVAKLNPPIGGRLEAVRVKLSTEELAQMDK